MAFLNWVNRLVAVWGFVWVMFVFLELRFVEWILGTCAISKKNISVNSSFIFGHGI